MSTKGNIITLVIVVALVAVGVLVFTRDENGSQPNGYGNGNDQQEEGGDENNNNTTANNDDTSQATTEDGAFVVRYTQDGFRPFIVELEQGEIVTFRNETNQALEVTTEGHPTASNQPYAGFNNSPIIIGGEEWGVPMLVPGVYGYKNAQNEEHLGTVVVKPQEQE